MKALKTITVTELRKNAADFIARVEQGETLVLVRRGRPVAEISPISRIAGADPSWKKPSPRLTLPGSDLSSAILEEREAGR